MSKIRVGVLRGGPSSEHEVSIETGGAILRFLPEDYARHDLFVDRQGLWHIDGFQKRPEDVMHRVDVVVNGMHGEYGEDGKVQKVLETLNIPFTGAGSFGSALSMNKALSKERYKEIGINVPFGIMVEENVLDDVHSLFREVPNPSIVKPASAGSSVGVRIVNSFQELEEALKEAFKYSSKVLIEEVIQGREATCGVIDNFRSELVYVLPPIEIIPESSFFDYKSKYSGKSKELCPGRFSQEENSNLMEIAKQAHEVLGLRHYSRSDFIIHPKRGIFILETNSLPGLTENSLFPKSLKAVGSNLSEFLDHVVRQALM